MDPRLSELVEAADLNALLRAVDGLVSSRDWDGLVELADACEAALERGKQLWPIAAHVDYRLALDAPGEYAADVLDSDLGRFAPGPLTEVAASTHTWDELAPHVDSPQVAAYVAQERVLRGEDLEEDDRTHPEVMGLPLTLQPFEPTYALATFHPNHVEVAEAWDPRVPLRDVPIDPAPATQDAELETVLLDLVTPWLAESNGAARVAIVEGSATGAASHLTYGSLSMAELDVAEALQRVAWAAASGGAHGRRRGAAYGRFMAFYLVATFGGLTWPVAPDDIADAASRLRWYRWAEGGPEKGWVLRVAVEDPVDGWAAAIAATDLLEVEDEAP
ncbi:MAG: hypothetical protein KY391_02105 [Actinobacteria bacterium]|nr:hypothetical protein [Actinomycetota bacterium]